MIVASCSVSRSSMNSNEMGLRVLTWVKKCLGNDVQIDKVYVDHGQTMDHQKWTNLLQLYVSEKGVVDYNGFISDSINLNVYLDQLSHNPPGLNWTNAEKLAYWINVYNAFTVKLIVNYYPLSSIKDISNGLPMINSPWDIKFFKIGDLTIDLNTIEHEILRKAFNEPRIHFAINCASFSCPRLRTEAYEAEKIEEQLEDQTIYFINNLDKNIITKDQMILSKIFNWFAGDFTTNGDLHQYIRLYYPNINSDTKIEYLEYDWSLNE